MRGGQEEETEKERKKWSYGRGPWPSVWQLHSYLLLLWGQCSGTRGTQEAPSHNSSPNPTAVRKSSLQRCWGTAILTAWCLQLIAFSASPGTGLVPRTISGPVNPGCTRWECWPPPRKPWSLTGRQGPWSCLDAEHRWLQLLWSQDEPSLRLLMVVLHPWVLFSFLKNIYFFDFTRS